MKKHDEGYVLVYVTVVLLVFCLVATTILTGAMNNLQNQQNTIAQMKDQYVAEGMIEQIVSKRGTIKFEKDTDLTSNVKCTDKQGDIVTLVATYNTVTITCSFDSTNGKYQSYQIGGVGE